MSKFKVQITNCKLQLAVNIAVAGAEPRKSHTMLHTLCRGDAPVFCSPPGHHWPVGRNKNASPYPASSEPATLAVHGGIGR
jgi:hypothetical protein